MKGRHYYSNYTDSRDIDCFFKIGDVAFHFASNGQAIPSYITREENEEVQTAVYSALANAMGKVETRRGTIEVLIRRELGPEGWMNGPYYDNRNGEEMMIEEYAESFNEMARVGFVSMDLDEDGAFHILAVPHDQNVPDEILQMLPEGDIKDVYDRLERSGTFQDILEIYSPLYVIPLEVTERELR